MQTMIVKGGSDIGPHLSGAVRTDGYEMPEASVLGQVGWICDQLPHHGARVRMMPDMHPGKIGPWASQ